MRSRSPVNINLQISKLMGVGDVTDVTDMADMTHVTDWTDAGDVMSALNPIRIVAYQKPLISKGDGNTPTEHYPLRPLLLRSPAPFGWGMPRRVVRGFILRCQRSRK
jgi:hypothetical protein